MKRTSLNGRLSSCEYRLHVGETSRFIHEIITMDKKSLTLLKITAVWTAHHSWEDADCLRQRQWIIKNLFTLYVTDVFELSAGLNNLYYESWCWFCRSVFILWPAGVSVPALTGDRWAQRRIWTCDSDSLRNQQEIRLYLELVKILVVNRNVCLSVQSLQTTLRV